MESKSPIPAQVKLVRCDLSDYLWHFCRDDQNPCDALSNILSMQLIRASVDRDTSLNKVSFTEAPLEQIRLQAPALRKERFPRFSLYGIGFSKTAIFRRGGLPVIYGSRSQLTQLPPQFKWRHVDLDLGEGKGYDYLWMREWRIESSLDFSKMKDEVIVVIPDVGEFEGVIYSIEDNGEIIDHEHVSTPIYTVHWPYISLNHTPAPIDDAQIDVIQKQRIG
jgi:hypothetical protein